MEFSYFSKKIFILKDA